MHFLQTKRNFAEKDDANGLDIPFPVYTHFKQPEQKYKLQKNVISPIFFTEQKWVLKTNTWTTYTKMVFKPIVGGETLILYAYINGNEMIVLRYTK